jgi:hypothetical protein
VGRGEIRGAIVARFYEHLNPMPYEATLQMELTVTD